MGAVVVILFSVLNRAMISEVPVLHSRHSSTKSNIINNIDR
jgi:hypothetical protein